MQIQIKNETDQLRTVVLGIAKDLGNKPLLNEVFDAKSYESVQEDIYPDEADLIEEMAQFESVLLKHGVEVWRPENLPNVNQVFARDIGFVIENTFFLSSIIPDRLEEQNAISFIQESLQPEQFIRVPENLYVEGGDVLVWNDYLFVGTYLGEDFKSYKTARTKFEIVDYLQQFFPNKKIVGFDLHKNDTDPRVGILHLDCTFQPVGKDKAIIYKEGFRDPAQYQFLVDLFGEENLFHVTQEEMYWMNPNVFSISPNVVVSERNFTRLNTHMREQWQIQVEEIAYREVSKMGGLLRCSTLPLYRNNEI